MNTKKIWDSYKFPLLLLGGIFIGAVLGMVLGEKATVLAPLGDNFSGLMSRSNMLPIIVFAIMSGFAVAKCGGEESWAGKLLNNLNDIIMLMVDIIMKLAPIGLGAYFANLVGEFGPQLIGDYGRTMLVYYPMCAVYVLIFFPLYSYFAAGKLGIRRMLKHIFNPAVTAFATQSSVAALPVNMEACKKIGVPDDISNIVLPMGIRFKEKYL